MVALLLLVSAALTGAPGRDGPVGETVVHVVGGHVRPCRGEGQGKVRSEDAGKRCRRTLKVLVLNSSSSV